MLWHFLIKGLEDLNLYPNLSVAFQMLLTRLCHLKDMPDPQEVINSMQELKRNDLNLGNSDDLIVEPKTQIKNISQELEKPKPNLNEKKITSKINSLDDLINIAEKEKEIELKFDLERNVKLVKFSNGKIDIAFNERLSKDFIKKLTSKLLEWTGNRWIITLSRDIGDQTVFEKKDEVKKKLFDDAKKTEVYQRIKELFPDAELSNVEKINKSKEEDL